MKSLSNEIAIEVKNVWENFRLYHHKSMTLKDTFVRLKKSAYEEFWALKGVSFKAYKGETLGIIGENGSGKSTLLKCICGVLEPSKGEIKVDGKISPLLELGAGFHPELSGRENVFINGAILGLTQKQVKERYDDIVKFAELEDFIDTQVKFYSSGMYIRLGFAVAVFSDPDILLVDEVLAVGDENFRKKCFDKIKEFQEKGKTIILVTHDLASAYRFCDKLALLNKGKLQGYGKPKEIARKYLSEAIKEEITGEKGTREIIISNIQLLNKENIKNSLFLPGDTLKIKFDFAAQKQIIDPIFGFAIYDQQGNHCFGTNTKLKKIKTGIVNGKGTISFEMESLPMLEGKFYLTIAASSNDETIQYHWLTNCKSFKVENPTDDVGSFYARVNCELQNTNYHNKSKQAISFT